jgi:hypothetical protein
MENINLSTLCATRETLINRINELVDESSELWLKLALESKNNPDIKDELENGRYIKMKEKLSSLEIDLRIVNNIIEKIHD